MDEQLLDSQNQDKFIEERKEKVVNFFKKNYNWVTYVLLAFLVWLGIHIRTLNLSKLKDITTGGWTLGPDLDPFLFLRWAKYIVVNGHLMTIDAMRYFPIGFSTKQELILHPYMIAWFHKIAVVFGSTSVDQSAVLYPVFFFALTTIAFFFLTREVFKDSMGVKNANAIALIATFFLIVLPSLLPRTIAGIPEKESAGFFFIFLMFYLFLKAWKAKGTKAQFIYIVLAALSTVAMSLVWGGVLYILLTIALVTLLAFFLGKVDKRKFYIFTTWLLSSYILMGLFSTRYSFKNLLLSTSTLIPVLVFGLMLVHFIIFNTKIKNYFANDKFSKIPKQIISLIIAIIVGIVLSMIIFGPHYIVSLFGDIMKNLITPVTDRLSVTVAENQQPFFSGWADNFGPTLRGFPIFFWLFFIGSIYLFSFMLRDLKKKDRIWSTIAYAFFLVAIVFSRYSGSSILNGTNVVSIGLYIIGVLVLIGSFGYYYYNYHKRGESETFTKIDQGLLLLFAFFFLSIISARGAQRTILVLVPTASILAAYLAVALFNFSKKVEDKQMKTVYMIVTAIVFIALLFSGIQLYKVTASQSANYAPTIYTQQWQKAMDWVRKDTPKNAVFAHWWDYGYWIQSIGERATVLDGGNAITYWNYLMGRYALTGTSDKDALEFLYVHNATHFLIDPTDIGKYSAFSMIGSDLNYDRQSYIPTLAMDPKQTQESSNSTSYIYTGGFALDSDVIYNINGTKLFLPASQAGIIGVVLERDSNDTLISQPLGVFVYQGNQYSIPLRYAYDNHKLIDFGSGLDAGTFTFTTVFQNQQGIQLNKYGAILYLSNRTVHSQLARLYLFADNDSYFKLAHSEDDLIVAQLKSQKAISENDDFIFFGDFRGPIKIWNISYPSNIISRPEYVNTNFPDKRLNQAK